MVLTLYYTVRAFVFEAVVGRKQNREAEIAMSLEKLSLQYKYFRVLLLFFRLTLGEHRNEFILHRIVLR